MRLLFFALIFLVSAKISFCDEEELNLPSEWKEFKKLHNKSYKNPKEEIARLLIWRKNLNYILAHNKNAENVEHSYRLKMNQFGDMDPSEFAKLFKNQNQKIIKNIRNETSNYSIQEIPVSVDWRTKGCVAPVRLQSEACNDIWAFGATESLAGITCVKSGNYISISAQQLIDCSRSFGNFGCEGGEIDLSYGYIRSNDGIDSDASYPFEAKDGACRFRKQYVTDKISGLDYVPAGNETYLTIQLANLGPIAVYVDASKPDFQFYSSGIYYNPTCSSVELDHILILVGYDSNGQGKDFYIAKNSWGPHWGLNGYIEMARNKNNNCGVASAAVYPIL